MTEIINKESRWEQVKQIFHAALEELPQKQKEFVRAACGGDAALEREVEQLIAYDYLAGTFMEEPAANEAAEIIVRERIRTEIGKTVGPYRLVREIGYGGMGKVYLAERADAQYLTRVAIKLVRTGLGHQSVIGRFRNERQILADLNHPNVAKLLDGGAGEDGLPYFVMEYIEGVPIDEYCHRHRLSIVQRLELFRTICSAVHCAHQSLVVHRDIKPSNILVTTDGVPKLLDFGIAKILAPTPSSDSDGTTTLQFLTPEYASPEQVMGRPITTASDIYSLGVLLYRLLTGYGPYRVDSHHAQDLARAICEEDPERPSAAIAREIEPRTEQSTIPTASIDEGLRRRRGSQSEKLRRRLAGDLDNIVLMALRKEPGRRYSSVEQFSEDIRRHLEGLPVIARKDTLGYRTGKFIQRHKAGVGAMALALIILLAGVIATRRQAHIAERRFNDVRILANSLLFELHDNIQNLPGATPARELLVKRALEYLDKLAGEAGNDRKLKQELATAYEKVGDVQGNPYRSGLGDSNGASESYRKGIAIRQSLLLGDQANAELQRELAADYQRIAEMLLATGKLQEALNNYQQGISICQKLLAAAPTDRLTRRLLATIQQDISKVQGNPFTTNLGLAAEAVKGQRQALEIFESLMNEEPGSSTARSDVAVALCKMGNLLWGVGDQVKPLEYYQRALEIQQRLLAADPNNVKVTRELISTYNNIGDLRQWKGDLAAALESYQRGIQTAEKLAGADPLNVLLRRDLIVCYLSTGDIFLKKGELSEALSYYHKALPICEELMKSNVKDVLAHYKIVICYQRIAVVQLKAGDSIKALENHQLALTQAESLLAKAPQDALVHGLAFICYENVGDMLLKKKSFQDALAYYQKGLSLAEALVSADPKNTVSSSHLGLSCSRIGGLHVSLAEQTKSSPKERLVYWREARSWYQRSLGIYLTMREQGTLGPRDAGEPDSIRKELAKCDAALAGSGK